MLKPYERYRSSGVEWLGDVPEHWTVKRGRFCMRVNPPSERLRELGSTDEVSFVPMEAVGEYGGLNLEVAKPLGDIGTSYTEFQNGDVIVAKITPCFENGKGALAGSLTNGVALGTTELHVLRTLPGLDRRFLFYLTISSVYRRIGEAEMYGAGGQKRVPPEFNKDFRTPVPPLYEQLIISDFLDRETAKIDTLVAKKRELIEKLKEKRTALISRTVTRGLPPDAARAAGLDPHPKLKPSGIEWLGDVPEHWEMKPLGYLVRFQGGATPDKGKLEYWDGDIPWVSPKDMKRSRISDTEDHISADGLQNSPLSILPTEAVLVVVRGMILAHSFPVALSEAPLTINQDMKALVCGRRIRPLFLYWMLVGLSGALVSLCEESAHGTRKLETGTLAKIQLPVPQLIEQNTIEYYLVQETGKLDQMFAKVDAAIERLQEYRTALITAAVTGKIDVRGTVA